MAIVKAKISRERIVCSKAAGIMFAELMSAKTKKKIANQGMGSFGLASPGASAVVADLCSQIPRMIRSGTRNATRVILTMVATSLTHFTQHVVNFFQTSQVAVKKPRQVLFVSIKWLKMALSHSQ